MKRWMSLAVGIALVVAGCSTSSTPQAPDEVGTPATVITTTVAPTTAAPATTLAAPTTTTVPPTTAPAPPPPTTDAPAPTTTAAPATTVAPTTTAAPATTVAPTTTAAPATWYGVDNPSNPAYYPEPVYAGSEYFGSGCTPGAGPLPDGVWYGELTSVGPNSFEFDLMCFAPLPPGSTEEDGIGDITNSNPTLRTVPVNPVARTYVMDPDGNWLDMPYTAWSAAPTFGNGCPPGCTLLGWIYINGGEATEITMVWTP